MQNKSFIEQELKKLDRDCINDHCYECTNSAIQKAREELIKEIDKTKECVSTIYAHNCKEHPYDCWFAVEYDVAKQIIEKVIGNG